ncbi:uncharacterized protein KY384_003738 [Bacidia gigantensis]|uniref:uncharacterized protein n=1 Tax=Bacidia gigantensis TaxID=2732470 RepID=UPI001D03B3E2|nr:uncharacterized protein KY384_003738 [Bacidia gigantensis]KAG8532101.1 hypothetical protein KY384_003738 [Bacidia gigantensis]
MILPTGLLYIALSLFTLASAARRQPERVLLSSIKTLTLRQGLKAAHNRVSPVSQLKCLGGTAKDLYEIDVLRCKNAGSSYDEADVEWTCTASLPAEFKLGSTDVSCEGFSGPNDPYVLKGSCGVEYRLMLTKLGEEKYGKKGSGLWDEFPGRSKGGDAMALLFWLAFIAVVIWMVYAAFFRDGPARRPGVGFGGFGDGGGGDDPPPPYDDHPPPSKPKTYSSPRSARGAPAQEGWRPGFWTGALGGGAAGYMAGNRGSGTRQQQPRPQDTWGNGEGSSRWGTGAPGPSRSSSSSSSLGSSRYESTGFGGTSRR